MSGNDPCDIYGHVLPLEPAGVDLNHLFCVARDRRGMLACDNDGVTHRVDGKKLLVSDGLGFTLGVDAKYHAKVLRHAEKDLFKVNGRLWVDLSRLVWVWGVLNGIQVCGGEAPVSVGGTAVEIQRLAKAARLTRLAPQIYAKLEHALYLHVDVGGDYLMELGRHPSTTSYLKVTKAYAPRLIASLARRGWGWHKSGTMVNPSMLALREKNSVIDLRNLGLSIKGFDAVGRKTIQAIPWKLRADGRRFNPTILPGAIDALIFKRYNTTPINPQPGLPPVPGVTALVMGLNKAA